MDTLICEPGDHQWVNGPFWITAAVTWEEADGYYPPNAKAKVLHCTKCGLLRLAPDARLYQSDNLKSQP